MQNYYGDQSHVKNRRTSPSTPKKKLQQLSTAPAVSPGVGNARSPRRTPRRLPTSPQRVELSTTLQRGLPMAPLASPPKRRQPLKAKNSSILLVGLRPQEPESRPLKSTNQRVYVWVLAVASLVVLSLVAQSRLTRNQDFAFFHDLPQRRTTGAEASTEDEVSKNQSRRQAESPLPNVESTQILQPDKTDEGHQIASGAQQDPISFAIVHLLCGDTDYTLDLYTIVASTFVQRKAGSQAQVIVYVTGVNELPSKHANLLQKFQILTKFIETPDKGDKTLHLDVFRRLMSDLVAYERVLFLSANIMARGSMDYFYHASKNGVFQENVVFADRQSPASAQIFMIRPTDDVAILDHSMFHPDNGWGHAFQNHEHYDLLNGRSGRQWDFKGADDTPGLLYHYARFERGRISIVLQDEIYSIAIDEEEDSIFESLVNLKDRKVVALADFRTCWPEQMDHQPCRAPHNTYFHVDYKPRPEDLTPENANISPTHFWHSSLDKLNAEYQLGLDPSAVIPNEAGSEAQFAYAFVVGGCDPENDASYKSFIWQVLINAYILREAKSPSDVILFVQMSFTSKADKLPEEELELLKRMNVRVKYIEKYKDESFDSIIMDKFRVLQLTQYDKIIFCDSDVMLRGSMDYIFDLSMRGVLQSNAVFSTELVPATGHLFMVSPLDGDWDHLMEISDRSGKFWNDEEGWGHSFSGLDGYDLTSGTIGTKWDFPGANADQGLLYHWVKYEEQSVSIFVGESIQNWGEHKHEATLMETLNLRDVIPASDLHCWESVMDGQPCKAPYIDYVHFSGIRKPWLQVPPDDVSEQTSHNSALHFWFHTLSKLNVELDMGIDFSNWRPRQVPLLGLSLPPSDINTETSLNGATYNEPEDVASPYTHNLLSEHRFAYAYVIGGVQPENPSYRNYFNDIMISTYNQREEGSKADVVVFVQMAFASKFDAIPDEDSRLLNAMNITVNYIPKTEDESFYRIMLDKFRVLGLTDYSRVIFMDGDVMAMGNLDYLFELSVKGVLKENVVFAGTTEPANGGFFLVAPKSGATDRIRKIIAEKEERGSKLPYPHWDNAVGWGHELEDGDYIQLLNEGKKLTDADAWNFYGSFADQGLLYHWVKYAEKSVSIVFRHSVQNWGAKDGGKVHLEDTLPLDIFDGLSKERKCWKGPMMKMKPCRAPHSDFIHFTGSKKPWLKGPPENYAEANEESPAHYWFHILSILNTKMEIGLDFENWRKGHRPTLGLYPLRVDAAKTNYS